MTLSKAQRKRFTDRGLTKAEIDEMETMLDADDGDADNGNKPNGSRRLLVYEGDDARSFMDRMFGTGTSSTPATDEASDDDAGDEDEAANDDAGDEDTSDEEPATGPKWFKGRG